MDGTFHAYKGVHGWDAAYTAGLATRTQLKRQKLVLPETAQPVAHFHNRYGDWPLYRREEAVPVVPKRQKKDWPGIFAARYPERRAAYLPACEALWNLNRFAKHPDCGYTHRRLIYALKDKWTEKLWREGFCIGALEVRTPRKELPCWSCGGEGDAGDFVCYDCEGTGVYRTVGGKPFWALRYEVQGKQFFWHQPAHLAPWAWVVGEEAPHEVVVTEKPVHMPKRKFAEAKALLLWLLDETVESLLEVPLAPVGSVAPAPDIRDYWTSDWITYHGGAQFVDDISF